MIVDIHTHIFPDDLASRALSKLASNSGTSPYTDGTVSGLRGSMQKAGIDKSVIAPIATKPSQVKNINQWAAELNQRYEDIIGFGTIHPEQDDWAQEIDRLLNDRIPGVKMHPDYQTFFVDDPKLVPIYQALADANLIVLFHSGVDVGLPPPVHCMPDRLAHVLDMVPEMKVIAGHMGGYLCWDEVERHLIGRNLYLDTSFSLSHLGPNRMVELIRAHGTDKILFGTDSPWTDQSIEVANIRALPLKSDEIDAILGKNAMKLLLKKRTYTLD